MDKDILIVDDEKDIRLLMWNFGASFNTRLAWTIVVLKEMQKVHTDSLRCLARKSELDGIRY